MKRVFFALLLLVIFFGAYQVYAVLQTPSAVQKAGQEVSPAAMEKIEPLTQDASPAS